MVSAYAAYMGSRIMAATNPLDYTTVVTKRPDLKTGIDEYLTNAGRTDLIA